MITPRLARWASVLLLPLALLVVSAPQSVLADHAPMEEIGSPSFTRWCQAVGFQEARQYNDDDKVDQIAWNDGDDFSDWHCADAAGKIVTANWTIPVDWACMATFPAPQGQPTNVLGFWADPMDPSSATCVKNAVVFNHIDLNWYCWVIGHHGLHQPFGPTVKDMQCNHANGSLVPITRAMVQEACDLMFGKGRTRERFSDFGNPYSNQCVGSIHPTA